MAAHPPPPFDAHQEGDSEGRCGDVCTRRPRVRENAVGKKPCGGKQHRWLDVAAMPIEGRRLRLTGLYPTLTGCGEEQASAPCEACEQLEDAAEDDVLRAGTGGRVQS